MFSCVKTKTNSNFVVKLAESSNRSSFSANLMNNLFLSMCQLNLENLLDCVNKNKRPEATKLSISINSCSIELSKTKLFPVINVKEKIIFPFYIMFWYRDFQASWGKLCHEK